MSFVAGPSLFDLPQRPAPVWGTVASVVAHAAVLALLALLGVTAMPLEPEAVKSVAVEQIRRAEPDYEPDVVVPYAFAETSVRDGTIVAEGAAFRSRREWYGLSFSCTPSPDFSGVTAFEFKLGDFIPHEEWDAHYLTAEEVGD